MTIPALEELTVLGARGWLVGGAVRDELLGRPTVDYDVVVPDNTRELARQLSRRTPSHAFPLSETFGAWRVAARDGTWQVDLMPLIGGSLEEDLARRDLTVNAIASPLGGGELIDPHGGLEDLAERRLRMVGARSFAEDPLRVVRLARLRADLDFAVDPATAASAAESARALSAVAPERVFAEVTRIVCGERPAAGLAAMSDVGATQVVLPELSALHGVEQSAYHHLDVYEHTIATLESVIALVADPARWFGEEAADGLATVLAEPLANELDRGQALRFGALFHDIAKASTRGVTEDGRITFMGHDRAGAEQSAAILTRLRASERLAAYVGALARHHLRLGFLVHEQPLDRHAVYRYLSACTPVEVEVTLLSVADRLATLGRNSERACELHLALAREMLPQALAFRADPPRAPVRGDELAQALGMRPGPVLGELLASLTEAAYAGEVHDVAEAIAFARALLAE